MENSKKGVREQEMELAYKRIRLTVLSCGILLFLIMNACFCSGSLVWSDDFDDGNYDGWTVGDGSFTADDQYLENNGSGWSAIEHASTVAYGTWSFWFYSNDSISSGLNQIRIYLIADEILSQSDKEDIPITNGYALTIDPATYDTQIEYMVHRYVAGDEWQIDLIWDVSPDFEVYGWYHINITRDCYGTFSLYGNDTLYFHFTDTTHTSSSLFGFACEQGQAFETVVISEIDCVPPTLPIEIILIGAGIAVVVLVIVLVVILIRRRRS